MILNLLVAAALLVSQDARTGSVGGVAPRGTSRAPLMARDALMVLQGEFGRIASVGDVDGGGKPDLVVARGRDTRPDRLDLIALESGETLRTLWAAGAPPFGDVTWDTGGDANGDGIPDVVLGFPEAGTEHERIGEVRVVSGADGSLLHRTVGDLKFDHYGASVAFLGDLDGDGRDDYAVGATQFDPCKPLYSGRYSTGSTLTSTGTTHWIKFDDGRRVEARKFWKERMRLRSPLPGSVSVRSGRDGSELWYADGDVPGHGFGTYVAAAGDLDEDGRMDLIVQHVLLSDEPIVLFSGATGDELERLQHRLWWSGRAGDLDADGIPDLILDGGHRGGDRLGHVELVSGRTLEPLFRVRYPDSWSEYGVTVPLGDIDGDGYDDLGIGEGNFNFPGSEEGGQITEEGLRSLSLADARAIRSEPQCAFSWQSGCALVVSGRTHEIVWGVWGRPGTFDGMGLQMTSIPDVNGDEYPDLVVVSADAAYVFAGPGPAPR